MRSFKKTGIGDWFSREGGRKRCCSKAAPRIPGDLSRTYRSADGCSSRVPEFGQYDAELLQPSQSSAPPCRTFNVQRSTLNFQSSEGLHLREWNGGRRLRGKRGFFECWIPLCGVEHFAARSSLPLKVRVPSPIGKPSEHAESMPWSLANLHAFSVLRRRGATPETLSIGLG